MIYFEHYNLKLTKYIKYFITCVSINRELDSVRLFAYFQYISGDIVWFID
jgi:hypothetical protein